MRALANLSKLANLGLLRRESRNRPDTGKKGKLRPGESAGQPSGDSEAVVIRPYTPPGEVRNRARRNIVIAVCIFSFFYGAFFALTAPFLIVPMLAPFPVLAALILWAMPDAPYPPTRSLEWFFFATMAGLVIWPNYLAISIPSLPWITVVRLTSVPMIALGAFCLSTSIDFRNKLSAILNSSAVISILVGCLFAIELLSITFSENKSSSIQFFINIPIMYFCCFLIAAYFLDSKSRAQQTIALIVSMAMILFVIGALEFRLGKVLWEGHIPSFLKIQSDLVTRVLAGAVRIGGAHRVQGTYTTSLGLSEYCGGLAFPFLIYFAVNSKGKLGKAASSICLPLIILLVVWTQARVGLVGICLSILIYPSILILSAWRRNPNSLAVGAAVLSMPAGLAAAVAIGALTPGIRIRVMGGGAAQLSNLSRTYQWHLGIPKFLHRPWGYGIGQGAEALGYYTPGGFLTIDSYTLKMALETGVLGCGVYYAIFIAAVIYAFKEAINPEQRGEESALFTPVAIALLNFIVIRGVYAQEDNQAIAFIILGLLVALRYRLVRARSSAPDAQLIS